MPVLTHPTLILAKDVCVASLRRNYKNVDAWLDGSYLVVKINGKPNLKFDLHLAHVLGIQALSDALEQVVEERGLY